MNLSQQQYYFRELQRRQALLRAYYNLQTQKVGLSSDTTPSVERVAINKLGDVQEQRDKITSVHTEMTPKASESDTVLRVEEAIKDYRRTAGLETEEIQKIEDIKTNTESLVDKLNGEA